MLPGITGIVSLRFSLADTNPMLNIKIINNNIDINILFIIIFLLLFYYFYTFGTRYCVFVVCRTHDKLM